MNQMITPVIRCACGLLVVAAIALPVAARSSQTRRARGLAGALDSLGTLLDAPGQKASPSDSDVDVRFTIWAPTALKPQPFLRLSRIGGADIRPELLAWWWNPPGIHPLSLPAVRRCTTPDQLPVCATPVRIAGTHDWSQFLEVMPAVRACDRLDKGSGNLSFDAGDLAIRTYEAGSVHDYSCQAPSNRPGGDARSAAHIMDVLTELVGDVTR